MFQSGSNFTETPFCRHDNFASAVTYLSKELQLLGHPPLVAVGHDKLDVICLINVVYELMNQVKQFQSSRKETEDHSHKVLTDLQHCQWQLARQKELNSKRERESAELSEKERQVSVRLRQTETALKKARDEIRQLTSDSELKQNQFQHALKRRDLENHRLNEQLVKAMRSKASRTAGANAAPEIEIRGSLTPAPLAGVSPRRKWDKADDVRKPLEDKWRSALAAAEREQRFVREDYQHLLQLVVKFTGNTGLEWVLVPGRSVVDGLSLILFVLGKKGPMDDWIQLPMSMIGSQLGQLLDQLEKRIDSQMKQSDRLTSQLQSNPVVTCVQDELDQLRAEKQRLAMERAALELDRQETLSKYLHLKEDCNVGVTASTTSAAVKFMRNSSVRPSEVAQWLSERSAAVPSGIRRQMAQLPFGPGPWAYEPHEPNSLEPALPLPAHPSIPVAEPLGQGNESPGASAAVPSGRGPSDDAHSEGLGRKHSDGEQQRMTFVGQNTAVSVSVGETSDKRPAEAQRLTAASGTPPTSHLSRSNSSNSNSSSDSGSDSGSSQKGRSFQKVAAEQFVRDWNRLEPPQGAASQTKQPQTTLCLHGNASISAKVSLVQEANPCTETPPMTPAQPTDDVPLGLTLTCRVTSAPCQ